MRTLRDARSRAPELLHRKGAFAGVIKSRVVLNATTGVFIREGQRDS